MRRPAAAAITIALTAAAVPSRAQDNDALLCGFYGTVAESIVEFVLPLTYKEVLDMLAGRSPELLGGMQKAMFAKIPPAQLGAFSTAGKQRASALAEAAGSVAFELLMTGQFATPAEIKDHMIATCNNIGVQSLIDNQIAANAAVQQSMGQ